MQLGEPGRVQPTINVTPLVDVVLVLLIICMVVAPQMRPGPQVDLPDTSKPPEQAPDEARVLVTIDERGELWIDDTPVTAEYLGAGLRAAARAGSDTRVLIQGDSSLRFGEVRLAMLEIERAGFRGTGLIAERAMRQAHGG